MLSPLAVLAQLADVGDPLVYLRLVFKAVTEGAWGAAAAALLVVLVAALRKWGQWFHEKLPDHTIADKVLAFIFDTKPGGWLLNFATTMAAGMGTALLAGEAITWTLLKAILTVSLPAAAIWGAVKDFWEWWQARKAAPAVAPVP